MIMFELGIVLLDKNIQYLLFVSRHSLIEDGGTRLEEGNTILNFESLQDSIAQLSRNQPASVAKVKRKAEELDKTC